MTEREDRPTLDYQGPPAHPLTSRRAEDVCLLGFFALYAAANFLMVMVTGPGVVLDMLWAFALPLPLVFIFIVVVARLLARPPLFSRLALIRVGCPRPRVGRGEWLRLG